METLANLTQAEQDAAIVGGVAGAVVGMIAVFVLVFYVLTVIATWKIFKKAGEPGWKCLIPIYNLYIMYKIVGMKNWFWWMLAISVCASIMMSVDGTANLTPEQLENIDWGQHPMTIFAVLISCIAAIWVEVVYSIRTSKAFGHGVGYAIGLFFLPNIFWLILGFDKSKYDKKALKKSSK